MIYDLLLIKDSTIIEESEFISLQPADGVTLDTKQGTPSFMADMVSAYDKPTIKKKGRWAYEIPKKYLIPFNILGQFCNTCNDIRAFRYWHVGVIHPVKAELECMICKTSIYIES